MSQSTIQKASKDSSKDISAQVTNGLSSNTFLAEYVRWAASLYGLPRSQNEDDKMMLLQGWPLNLIQQSIMLNQQLWQNTARAFTGMAMPNDAMPSKMVSNKSIPREATGPNLSTIDSGELVYENEVMTLMEHRPLIQKVHEEPVLFVPSWILTNYLFDATAQNALVKLFTEQGFSVFSIAWKDTSNIKHDYTIEDYRHLGVQASLDFIAAEKYHTKVHGLGIFLGGTLLTTLAAQMGKNNQERFKTLSVFAAQIDFSDIAKNMQMRDKSQIAVLENFVKQQNANALQNSQEALPSDSPSLVWPYFSPSLFGYQPKQDKSTDTVDTSNADISYKTDSRFLCDLILQNDFAKGACMVGDKSCSLRDINIPTFVIDTERDHLTTWESIYHAYESHDSDVMFLLASGGYYRNEDDKPREPERTYRVGATKEDGKYLSSDNWKRVCKQKQGSWWPELTKWLIGHSNKTQKNR